MAASGIGTSSIGGSGETGGCLAANLGALFATNLELARQLDALEEGELPTLVGTRSGRFTCAVKDAAGQMIYLHSRHDPEDEARRLIKSVEIGGKVCFTVHGMGLGYHVSTLLDALGRETLTLVFESDLGVLRRALECVDISRSILRRRVEFLTSAERPAMFAAIGMRMVMMSMGLTSIVHAPSHRRDPEFHGACSKLVTEFASFSRTSLNTLVMNGRRTAENISQNTGWYAAAGGIARLRGKYAGKPAIVVSAGPSLRKNQHLLASAAGGAVVVAVQTTLKPMLAVGVEPDFVTSLDYHEICSRFFEGLPEGLRTELIVEPKATRKVMRMHTGPVSVVGNDFADALLREMELERPRLQAGATVAHLAFYVAEYLGCDPIIFVGQDLGFSDGLCYAPGTSYDDVWRPELGRFATMEMKQWEQIVRERPILRRIPDVAGNPMYTEERLFTYLQQFERDFANTKAKVIDCTEGGALKRGAEVMPLAEAIGKYCGKPIEREVVEKRVDFGRAAEVASCLRKRRDEAKRIVAVAKETLPLLQEIKDHIDDQPRVNRAIARIDALRAKMNELGATYDLVTQLTQSTELQRFEADMKLSASKELDEHERQKRQVERDLINCRAILEAGEEFVRLMEVCAVDVEACVVDVECGGAGLESVTVEVKASAGESAGGRVERWVA
jgi:hypothetical protein